MHPEPTELEGDSRLHSRMLNGRYRVEGLLGRGGMADVYRGQDERLSRTVAIKILRADLARDPQFLSRFRREARAVAGLNHPAIVSIYDTGETTATVFGSEGVSVPFIVMEYVDGVTIENLIEEGRISCPQAVQYTLGVLSALECSHIEGIVHRDIKPANVMLTKQDTIKVMDFGIARAIADSGATMTQNQTVIGTAQYLSPEQARGESGDARSDLYSTACLLYEMLTGRPPFTGDSAVSVAYQHVREFPEPPSGINSAVPAAIDSVLVRALQKEPSNRYPDAATFAAALRSTLTGTLGGNTHTAPLARVPVEETEDWSQDPLETLSEENVYSDEIHSPARRQRRRWRWFLVISIVLLAAAAGYLMYFNWLQQSSRTTVPEITGLSKVDALAEIYNAKLRSRMEEVYSDSAPVDTVVDASPSAGTTVAKDSEVTLRVSKGPANITLPENVVGMTESAARSAMSKLGLTPGDTTIVDSGTIPAGQVVSTDPAAGSTVPAEEKVDIHVSSGQVRMPALYGKKREEIEKLFAEKMPKMRIEFREVERGQVEPGTVIEQSVEPEGQVSQTGTVSISMAKEPQPSLSATPSPTPSSRDSR